MVFEYIPRKVSNKLLFSYAALLCAIVYPERMFFHQTVSENVLNFAAAILRSSGPRGLTRSIFIQLPDSLNMFHCILRSKRVCLTSLV